MKVQILILTHLSIQTDSLFNSSAFLRAVGRSENPGVVPVLFGVHNLPPLVDIGLTVLPKSGGAMASPAPPGTTGLEIGIVPTSH